MGRLVPLFICFLALPSWGENHLSHEDMEITELHRDLIREYYAEKILGYPKGVTRVPENLSKIRHKYKPTFLIQGRTFPAYQKDLTIRIFNQSPVAVDEVLLLISKATDYSVQYSNDVNRNQLIYLGEDYYSLPDIVNYINVVTNLHIDISEEGKLLTVHPAGLMN